MSNNPSRTTNNDVLLHIEDLTISFFQDGEQREVVKNISFDIPRGRTVGIVGESGSGKSVSSLSLMGLLPPTGRVDGGAAIYMSSPDATPINLLALDSKSHQQMLGSHLAMVFQEPMTSLNPVKRCGWQVREMLQRHEKLSNRAAKERVLQLFEEVLLPDTERIYRSYPHEISGGQKQRVMIAMALICHPRLLIADEPTTALDVTVQRAILQLLKHLQQRHNISILFISHDLGVISQIADHVVVMHHGRIVEQGDVRTILKNPSQDYTRGLLSARPPLNSRPMHLPTLHDFLNHLPVNTAQRPKCTSTNTILDVSNLNVHYVIKKNLFGHPTKTHHALKNISFSLHEGETLGIVGESGCGKTTLGRAILNLVPTSSGSVLYHDEDISHLPRKDLLSFRQKVQIIFQDPYSSLNPRLTIGQAILEPLLVHQPRLSDKKDLVLDLMQQVGLEASFFNRYPHALSGGQRQRACIARALILRPELVICDESVAALDLSVAAQVLNLINDMKQQYHFSCLFITHDLSVVKYMSDRIMVLKDGQIVELDDADNLYNNPQSDYTRNLIASIPIIS